MWEDPVKSTKVGGPDDPALRYEVQVGCMNLRYYCLTDSLVSLDAPSTTRAFQDWEGVLLPARPAYGLGMRWLPKSRISPCRT